MRRAAALVIGNEILTGKVVEGNIAFLAKELFVLGIRFERVIICPDVPEHIARDVNALREAHDYVFTSGGVGPTHDDVTVPSIAAAFGVSLTRDEALSSRIRAHFGERTTEGHLRMADMPVGATLLARDTSDWPVLQMGNVFVMPGVPDIFRRKFALVKPHLDARPSFVSGSIFAWADEGEIASTLEQIEHAHEGVLVGSYPRFDDADHSVKLTFDGISATRVLNALLACKQALIAKLGEASIVRLDLPEDAAGE